MGPFKMKSHDHCTCKTAKQKKTIGPFKILHNFRFSLFFICITNPFCMLVIKIPNKTANSLWFRNFSLKPKKTSFGFTFGQNFFYSRIWWDDNSHIRSVCIYIYYLHYDRTEQTIPGCRLTLNKNFRSRHLHLISIDNRLS